MHRHRIAAPIASALLMAFAGCNHATEAPKPVVAKAAPHATAHVELSGTIVRKAKIKRVIRAGETLVWINDTVPLWIQFTDASPCADASGLTNNFPGTPAAPATCIVNVTPSAGTEYHYTVLTEDPNHGAAPRPQKNGRKGGKRREEMFAYPRSCEGCVYVFEPDPTD